MMYDKTISIKVSLEQFDLIHNEAADNEIDVSQLIRQLIDTLKNKGHLANRLEYHRYQCKVIEDKLNHLEEPKKEKTPEADHSLSSSMAQEIIREFKGWGTSDDTEQESMLEKIKLKFIEYSKKMAPEEMVLGINKVNKLLLGFDKSRLNKFIDDIKVIPSNTNK